MTEIQINAQDGSGNFMAYIAMPEKTPAPAIIMIQEIFGVNQEMRKKCDEMAKAGFIAVCPDLFWRIEPGVQLTDKTEEEWAKAFDFFNKFDVNSGVADLKATLDVIRQHDQCNGNVGAIGYCLGGKLAYLMATRTNVDAAVGYYGVGLDELLNEADNIKKPLMLHIAEEDKFVSPEQQKTIKAGLKEHNMVTIHSYADVNHAFARDGGEHFDEAAANAANARTRDFITETLKAVIAA